MIHIHARMADVSMNTFVMDFITYAAQGRGERERSGFADRAHRCTSKNERSLPRFTRRGVAGNAQHSQWVLMSGIHCQRLTVNSWEDQVAILSFLRTLFMRNPNPKIPYIVISRATFLQSTTWQPCKPARHTLSYNTIKAVVAEQHLHYGRSRLSLQTISTKRPLAVFKHFYSQFSKADG